MNVYHKPSKYERNSFIYLKLIYLLCDWHRKH